MELYNQDYFKSLVHKKTYKWIGPQLSPISPKTLTEIRILTTQSRYWKYKQKKPQLFGLEEGKV